jgi:predicted RND superfamily exporter protein
MWNRIAQFIINNRLVLIIAIALLTVFMGYEATKVQMSYDFARTVPPNDPDMVYLNEFKKQFGEDGNIIAVGIKDSAIYKLDKFYRLTALNDELKNIPGVNGVMGLPSIKMILKDTDSARFILESVFPKELKSQQELDSLLELARGQKNYMGQLVNLDNGALMLLVSVNKEVMNSAKRVDLTNAIVKSGSTFTEDTGIELRYAGLPFVRAIIAEQVRKEMSLFLYLSALITGMIMFLFFRSFRAVLFSMVVIAIMVIWVMGTLALFGYKITLLSGLIPPVIVTIGITNAIYLLNKYHLEFARTGDKVEAISVVVKKMGLATFLTNLTVAIGFLTLLSTDIPVLREFGVVAGINIMALFVLSLIMIPGIFSWLPTPSEKHLRHLNFKILGKFVWWIDRAVTNQKVVIYIASVIVAILSVYGITKLHSVSFMVDDIPEESQIKKDLKFFEANFSGIMPLEIEIDIKSKKKRPVLDPKYLKMVNDFEKFLDSIPEVSRPVSIVSLVKALNQAYHNNNPSFYALPGTFERPGIQRYLANSDIFKSIKGTEANKAATDSATTVNEKQSSDNGLFKSFVDPSLSKIRISCQIADIGSVRMDSLVHNVIEPRMNSIFVSQKKDTITTAITGSTKIFIKGNKFLISNLQESLLLAFLLITLSMAILFANVRMIIISLIPNLLALMITAGLMGYFNIPLKASTALIFSITFGISVDNSIRFLAKYRQEILSNNFFVAKAVSDSILETGKSIIYTSIVLFAGFIIFAFSSFGGTIALGILTSTTLVISMFTNLILLPALILSFDKPKKKKGEYLLIDDFDSSFYGEEEDEAIDLNRIKIHNRHSSAE